METKDLDYYLSLPWQHSILKTEGGFMCAVAGLDDFEMFSDSYAELAGEWRTALTGLLRAYIATGKSIPEPQMLFTVVP